MTVPPSTTAPTTRGPAHGPRPASSMPRIIEQIPYIHRQCAKRVRQNIPACIGQLHLHQPRLDAQGLKERTRAAKRAHERGRRKACEPPCGAPTKRAFEIKPKHTAKDTAADKMRREAGILPVNQRRGQVP